MARARSIKPSFFDDTGLARCSHSARLLFVGLWTEADRLGIFEWDPMLLRKKIFGYDSCTISDVEAWLFELGDQGLLRRAMVEGKMYGHVTSLQKHQNFHRDESARWQHVADTVPAWCKPGATPAVICNPLPVICNHESVTGNPDLAPQVQTQLVLTAPPSAPAVIGEEGPPKRNATQKARSVAVNRRYRVRYEQAAGKPPSGADQAFNGMIAKFSDKHADNAIAIVDQFFDSPNGFYRLKGWPVQLLVDAAPALWREVDDERAARENLAMPQQQRLAATQASGDIELERAKQIMRERRQK